MGHDQLALLRSGRKGQRLCFHNHLPAQQGVAGPLAQVPLFIIAAVTNQRIWAPVDRHK